MIRPLSPADLELYRAIRSAALRTDPDAFGETIAAFEARPEDRLRGWFEDHVTGGRGILVHLAGGEPRAMTGWGVTELSDQPGGPTADTSLREGFLWGMFVSPSVRRRGVGAALVRQAALALEDRRADVLQAHVAAPNEGAIRFYRALGFRVAGRVGVLREGSDIPVYRVETRVDDLLGAVPDRASEAERPPPGELP